ncbi:hypothetical protein DTO212C5_3856 [Paecilomyces variotii]|nr:hypothetical protein DTO212C5_3856 [Paecilomyces variotii]
MSCRRSRFTLSPSISCLLLLLLLFFSTASVTRAQSLSAVTVLPSNNSQDLVWTGILRFNLRSTQVELPSVVDLAPLTRSLVASDQSSFTKFGVTGDLVNVDASNSADLKSGQIAYISCDNSAYPGNIGPGATVANVITSHQAAAILLYSSQSNHCNFTADASLPSYQNIFTVLISDSSLQIKQHIDTGNSSGSTSIVPDMSTVSTAQPSGGSGDNGDTGSPNNAMIILYSITGVITALFLCIIITGAVRAHRHPERYGPRRTAGRPRQSRARGIARAMLETIPIVKFGDPYDASDPAKADIEMASGSEEEGGDAAPEGRKSASGQEAIEMTGSGADATKSTDVEKAPQAAAKTTGSSGPEQNAQESGNYSCPICTDDFVKGQDLRVLPCNHQFHPECVDPWLVNVSGTCPLCRIDLNPAQAEEDGPETEHGDNAAPVDHQGAEQAADVPNTRHNRLSSYFHNTLNVRRMREASVEERIATLRRFRQANRDSANAETAEETENRRNWLTSPLRDRFRIRTRQHDGPSTAPASES